MRTIIFLILSLGISSVFSQNYQSNITIQLGGQARFSDPGPINFAIDSLFNDINRSAKQSLSPVKWTMGFSGGIGYHKGRANLRLLGSVYSFTTTALYSQSGEDVRRDLSFTGIEGSLTLTSELIPITDIFGFNVGGGLSATNFRTASLVQPESTFDESASLTEVDSEWKVGFIIQTPFRVGIGPQVKISIEPFYQVFFSPINANALAEELTGVSGPSDKLRGDADHAGFTATIMVYLRRN